MTRNKLSVRKDTLFKKASSTLYKAREATVLKKAFELSELCGVDVCIICYDREGNLVKTWPENDEAKVRVMAERYSMLSEQERNKKSNNLSRFLNKKMVHDKEESMSKKDNRFLQKVLGFEDSLQTRLQTLKDYLQRFHPQEEHTVVSSSKDLSLINGPDHHHHQPIPSSLLNYPTSNESCVDVSTTAAMNQPPTKFSVLLYNHENGMFTQLANYSSALPSFEQPPPQIQDYGTNYMDLLLGEQGCNNFDLLMPTTTLLPPMQTQTPSFEHIMQTQPVYNNQSPYFGVMLS